MKNFSTSKLTLGEMTNNGREK